MNARRLLKFAFFFLFLVCCFPRPAMAYVGPGSGMTAVGVFLALVMGVVVAMFGFIWYPFKRFVRFCKTRIAARNREQTT
jgi:hypothetical protein